VPVSKHRHRYSPARREEAAWILDICASSRRDRYEWEWESKLWDGPDGRLVNTRDVSLALDVHWRSVSLADSAFYATFTDGVGNSPFHYESTYLEAAQRLREGWQLTGDKYCPLWKYE